MKTAKSFRLSMQAVSSLQSLSDETGTSETAIVEQALWFYRQLYESIRDEQRLVRRLSRDAINAVSVLEETRKADASHNDAEFPVASSKKRRRRKK
jgi:hypothetical protein